MLTQRNVAHHHQGGMDAAAKGGSTLEGKYKQTQKLLLKMRSDLEYLAQHSNSNSSRSRSRSGSQSRRAGSNASSAVATSTTPDHDAPDVLLSNLMRDINVLSRESSELDPLIAALPDAAQRQVWALKKRQLFQECAAMRSSIDRVLNERNAQAQRNEQRARLLGGATGRGASTDKGVQQLLAESSSLERSIKMVHEMEQMGTEMIDALIGQSELIKQAHKKVLDMGSTLGVSRSLMRMIERRQFFDKLIVYGGMLFTLCLLFLLWWWK